ncbi:hypothetical protein LOAG_11969, partial [Loa loa]
MDKNLNVNIETTSIIPTDQNQRRNNLMKKKVTDEITPLFSRSTEEDVVNEIEK